MEPGVRKILPRAPPTGVERDSEVAHSAEALRNGNGLIDHTRPERVTGWRNATVEEEGAPKRKRQHVEESSPANHPLPPMRQVMPPQIAQQPLLDSERAGPARLIRTGFNAYSQQGTHRFLSPPPPRDFPAAIHSDPRDLSFAVVEPDLMELFRRAYYLRHHVRPKRLSGAVWCDHVYFNDTYAIDNILRNWISRYEPGVLQYPASILYKQCLWIFFSRSIQPSESTSAFRHMVDDGLHFLRTFENELGAHGDRSVLLIPIFILGSTSFYAGQRQEIWTSLNRLDPSYSIDTVMHAARSLERIWEMMDDGRVSATWDWEKYQAHDYAGAQVDRSLIELLWDPLAPPPPPPQTAARVRSPEQYDFDPGRFRAAPVPIQPPPQPQPRDASQPKREEGEEHSPPQHPPRHHSTASVDAEPMRVDASQEGHHPPPHPYAEAAATPRAFIPPPPPHVNMHTNNDIIQVLQRKSSNKSKSTVPPCTTCGKELKNPSDAQKHYLQHSKPYRCSEPGCTRTQGFATENDLQRHRKSVHGASPRIGNKIGYICAACPDPTDGTHRKWWPRLDNFKAHIRRKHPGTDEERLIQLSASARRPDDAYSEHSYSSSHVRTPGDGRYHQSLRSSRGESMYVEQNSPFRQSYPRSKSEGNEEDGSYDQGETQGDGDGDGEGSEMAERTPKTESEEGEGEGEPSTSGGEAMDVSPTGEAEQGDGVGEREGDGEDD
ncbi:uncharacterized protein LTR77_010440 [Saxophila tyrrhenica]|uniref:C2H2-type domain-containing protein n=1 Tax=Saxophila tyrrhenica TaxID=1690608 RepID=A0AAV9NWE3_9PEZI|nr:hypothetical protein LTR77_010440 [Saxophila tyrrhenica]